MKSIIKKIGVSAMIVGAFVAATNISYRAGKSNSQSAYIYAHGNPACNLRLAVIPEGYQSQEEYEEALAGAKSFHEQWENYSKKFCEPSESGSVKFLPDPTVARK